MKRTHFEPFPKTGMLGTLHYVRRALSQPSVQKVEITARGIEVVREMDDADAPVVPGGVDDLDIGYILDRVELKSYPFDPEEHAMYVLYGAMREIQKTRREVHAIVAPGWPVFAAWLGLEAMKRFDIKTEEPPQAVFGAKIVFVAPSITNDRVIVLGAPPNSLFLSDTDMAVAVDLGV